MTRIPSYNKRGRTLRRSIPFVSALCFVLLSGLSLPLPYLSAIVPMLGLMSVYYWGIYRPDLFGPLAVFVIGLTHDLVHLLPIGLSAVLFLVFHQLILGQRRVFVGQIFPVVWLGFALTALIVSSVQWAVLSFLQGQWLSLIPVGGQFLLTVLVYPFPAWLLMRLHKKFLTEDV